MKPVLVAALVPLCLCLHLARADDKNTNITNPSNSVAPGDHSSGSNSTTNTTQKAMNVTASTAVTFNITTTVRPTATVNVTTAAKITVQTATTKAVKSTTGKPASPNVTTATPKPVRPSLTASPKAAAAQASSSGFSAGSFLGGIVLTLGLLAIGYVGCRTYHAKRGVQYRTIDEHDAII
ncbi:porimin [Pogona vitticeps]|uniref:Porimin n=1 Tax=Pogona vitticeps TaxID=103695 RepID=A0A6J0TTK6_9SAUR|nr:porimin [Pogona vitticeps]